MLFSSNIFIFLFLPATLVGYYVLPKRFRNAFLLIMSLCFYAWGEPKFVFVMMVSIVCNYVMAMLVSRYREQANLRKIFLVLCLAGNLGLLFIFKYLGFFITTVNYFGAGLPVIEIALPIGISFFTFQAMSYVIDVSRGDVKAQKRPHNVGLFIALFPQLMAGPIIRYKDFEGYIDDRNVSFDMFSEGVRRFIIGFSKKVLIANNMAMIADHAFGLDDVERSMVYAWLGAIAYSLQILFDFSGYSDMAIGLGRMFGFRFLENFNYPYISKSISEFWRRWHMSLGRWFRDYVYFPLGGSRVDSWKRLVFNLFVVWLLTGAWHGASTSFVIWGLLYFVLIAFEKLTGYPGKFKKPAAEAAYRVFTMLCVVVGWVIFRSDGMQAAAGYCMSMLGLAGNPVTCDFVILTFREYWLFLLVALICSTELPGKALDRLANAQGKIRSYAASTLSTAFYMFCFIWAISFIVLGSYNPFIYFNF